MWENVHPPWFTEMPATCLMQPDTWSEPGLSERAPVLWEGHSTAASGGQASQTQNLQPQWPVLSRKGGLAEDGGPNKHVCGPFNTEYLQKD